MRAADRSHMYPHLHEPSCIRVGTSMQEIVRGEGATRSYMLSYLACIPKSCAHLMTRCHRALRARLHKSSFVGPDGELKMLVSSPCARLTHTPAFIAPCFHCI